MAVSKRWFRCGAALAATLVAGCSRVPIPSMLDQCEPVPSGAFEAVDWDAARRINVRVRHGEFGPSLIRLLQDRPYVMRLENRDSNSSRFHASGFFAAVHLHSITRSSGPEASVSCPSGIVVAPREVVEVRFIAARDGRYEYRDNFLPFMFGGIPDGIVHIEAPPVLAALMPPAITGITKPDEIPVGPYAPASLPLFPSAPEAPSPAEPAAAPIFPPAPETPSATEPAVAPVIPSAPEIPAIPVEPSALPVPMPAPETPAMPAEPAVAPVIAPAPEIPPAIPTEPVTLPVPLPAPETPPTTEPAAAPIFPPAPEAPSATEPAVAPVVPPAPETPTMPTEPSALPVPMPAPETPSPAEPAAAPIFPPVPETPPATEPVVAPVVPPAPKTPAVPTEPSALPLPIPAPETPAPESPPATAPLVLPPPIIDKPRPLAPEHAPSNISPPRSGGVGLFSQ